MAKQVSFNIKLNLNGKEQFVEATTNVKALAKELGIAQKATEGFGDKLQKSVSKAFSFDQALQGLQAVTSQLLAYSKAYDVQIEAETQLAQAMRNTMNAREEDIQSIKDLCSAQQELGVIGDEVQLSGAQELSTYIEQVDTLKTLIPVMNDMTAQQYGLNATQESAVTIATMLGKVMNGQTTALSRLGYSFTDAQEQILKFGTEAERASTLAEVVNQSVGGMNASLAQTDSGKAKQMANYLGDLKEQAGAFYASIAPSIQVVSELGIALLGFGQMANGIKGVTSAMVGFGTATKANIATLLTYGKSLGVVRAVKLQYITASRAGTVATFAFSTAIKGLLIATGVGIAIVALTTAISALSSSSDDAKDSTELLSSATEEYKQAGAKAQAEIQGEIQELEKLKGSNVGTAEAVERLNKKYGDVFGTFATTEEWYNRLITKSKEYVLQKAYEALNAEVLRKQAEAKFKLEDAKLRRAEMQKKGGGYYATASDAYSGYEWETKARSKAGKAIDEEIENLTKDLTALGKESERANKIIADIKADLKTGVADEKAFNTQTANLRELKEEIQRVNNELEFIGGNEATSDKAKALKNELMALQKAHDSLERAIGRGSTGRAKATTAKSVDKAVKGSLQWFEDQIKELKTELWEVTDEATAKGIKSELDALEEKYKAKKISLGIETAPEVKEEEVKTYVQTLKDKIQELQRSAENAPTITARAEIYAQIDDLQKQIDEATAGELTIKAEVTPSYIKKGSLDDIRQSYSNAQAKAQTIQQDYNIGIIGAEEAKEKIRAINEELASLDANLKPITIEVEEKGLSSTMSTIQEVWQSVASLGNSFESLTYIMDSNASAWDKLQSAIGTFFSIFNAVNNIISFVSQLSGLTSTLASTSQITATAKAEETTATTALAGAKVADMVATQAQVAGAVEQVGAFTAIVTGAKTATASLLQLASAQYLASHAHIPFAGFAIGSGFAGAAKALVEAIGATPFANGGIVSGPTLALVGEYGGAKNNPEVIAPLNKLKTLIEPQNGVSGEVVFKIGQNELVGVLKRAENKSRRM